MSDAVIHEGMIEKFSLGRSTGLSSRNWQTRLLRLTKSHIMYMPEKGGVPKLKVPLNACSVLMTNPTVEDHEMVGDEPTLMLRLFDEGVFDLMFKVSSDSDKRAWILNMKEAMKGNKGFQVVENAATVVRQQQMIAEEERKKAEGKPVA